MSKKQRPALTGLIQKFVQCQLNGTTAPDNDLQAYVDIFDLDVAAIVVFSPDQKTVRSIETFPSEFAARPDFLHILNNALQDHLGQPAPRWRASTHAEEFPHCLSHLLADIAEGEQIQLSLWSSSPVELSEAETVFLEMACPVLAKKIDDSQTPQDATTVLTEALNAIEDGFIMYDENEKIIAYNNKQQKLFPSLADTLRVGESYENILRKQLKLAQLDAAKIGGENWIKERRLQLKTHRHTQEQEFVDGQTIRLTNYQTKSGNTVAVRSDITELVHARQKALENEALFRTLLEGAPIPLIILIDGVFAYGNSFAHALFGTDKGTLNGQNAKDFYWREKDWATVLELLKDTDILGPYELDMRTKDGCKITVSITSTEIIYQDKKARFASLRDITEAARTKKALAQSEKQVRNLLELIPDAIIAQVDGTIAFVNESALRLFRAESKDQLIGLKSISLVAEEDRNQILAIRKSALSGKSPHAENMHHLRLDQTRFPTELYAQEILWDGKPGTVSIIKDQSKRLDYENSLIQKEKEMSRAQAIGHFGHWRINLLDDTVYWSEELYRIHGLDPATKAVTLDQAKNYIIDEDRPRLTNLVNKTIVTRLPQETEIKIKRDGGEIRCLSFTMQAEPDEAGRVVSIFGACQDVTLQRILEEKLRQSQKMEAIGQLTGGVAHDFNNLLAVILGNAEMLLDLQEDLDESKKSQLRAIIKASGRGADLTRSMLAYSRKQDLNPSITRLDNQVESMINMLTRTLGEEINISFSSEEDLWSCVADAGQVEAALLNLALNARDAMPEGGDLVIETKNISLGKGFLNEVDFEPGDYVMLAVSDTGNGIGQDSLKRVFEPFYTTKDTGKGTGLGLSMVYGFTKQSGGHVTIDSKMGTGTTVKIFLPFASAVNAPRRTRVASPTLGKYCILVVEDDPDMQALTVELLSSMEADVLCANDGPAALQLAEQYGDKISLLLTDVVLPGNLNGPDIAGQITAHCPSIKIMYMSGYTDGAFSGKHIQGENTQVLHKPFRRAELAHKIEQALQHPNLETV